MEILSEEVWEYLTKEGRTWEWPQKVDGIPRNWGLDRAPGGHREGPLPGDFQPGFMDQAGSHPPGDMYFLPGKVRGVFVPHTFFFKNFRPRANFPSRFPHSGACMQKQTKEQKLPHASLSWWESSLHSPLPFLGCTGSSLMHTGFL